MAKATLGANPPVEKSRLVWIERVTPPRTRTHKSRRLCHCGKEFIASNNNVRRGHTKSCGCQHYVRSTKFKARHGHFVGNKPSKTYVSWQAMIARCTNPKHPAYAKYHDAGITICDRWLKSFDAFLADMGERPAGKTLDRYPDPAGNYEPDNCRWATPKEQQRNRRDNRLFELRGYRATAIELYEKLRPNVSYSGFRKQLYRGTAI